MGACTKTTKFCLLFISFVFWGAAAALCYVSSWVLRTYHDFDHFTEATLTLVPAFIVLGLAVLMFLVGLLGCIAVCKENKILLSAFFFLILVVFLGEVVSGTLGYVYRYKVEDVVSNGLTDAVNNYNDTFMKDEMDLVQRELHCCGVHNASDWLDSPYGELNDSVPMSCCIQHAHANFSCNTTIGSDDIYDEGCLSALEDKFTSNLMWIAVISITFAILQILGLMSSCILICRTQTVKYDRLGDTQHSGLRV